VEYRDCSQLQHWHSSRHAAELLRFYDSARDRPSYFRCGFADCSHDLCARNGSRTEVELKVLTERLSRSGSLQRWVGTRVQIRYSLEDTKAWVDTIAERSVSKKR